MWARFTKWVDTVFIQNPQTELERYIATQNVQSHEDLERVIKNFEERQRSLNFYAHRNDLKNYNHIKRYY
jgi:hypothetical protein